ncbi:MAG: hypothetical protein IPK52_20620 [Chloroflexi bacterium]|nr:hypothetical protein [Chloroflexota bacterium]
MYNPTVDEAHTFFVGDGDWLVHNCETIVTRDFAHSTSMENIDNILKEGLNESAAKISSRRGLINRPGSFYTVEVTPATWSDVGSDIIGFGHRHATDGMPAILIMKMPDKLFEDLVSRNLVLRRPLAGLDHLTEVVFSGGSFPLINKGIDDGIVTWAVRDPFKDRR